MVIFFAWAAHMLRLCTSPARTGSQSSHTGCLTSSTGAPGGKCYLQPEHAGGPSWASAHSLPQFQPRQVPQPFPRAHGACPSRHKRCRVLAHAHTHRHTSTPDHTYTHIYIYTYTYKQLYQHLPVIHVSTNARRHWAVLLAS